MTCFLPSHLQPTAALFNPELPKQVAEYLKKNKIIRKI
jgi:hypothetical protein